MALQGHRDDDKTPSGNPGNFKSLVEFRVESSDSVLRDHLKKRVVIVYKETYTEQGGRRGEESTDRTVFWGSM
jgi:hypothetical protein